MNSTIRNRDQLGDFGVRRLPTHPLEAPLADSCGGVAVDHAIVRYRPLLARIVLRRRAERLAQLRLRLPRVRNPILSRISMPEHRVRMPKCLKKNDGRWDPYWH